MRNYALIVCSNLSVRLPAETDSFHIGEGSFASYGLCSFLLVVCRSAWLFYFFFADFRFHFRSLVKSTDTQGHCVTMSRTDAPSLTCFRTQLCHLFLYLGGITHKAKIIFISVRTAAVILGLLSLNAFAEGSKTGRELILLFSASCDLFSSVSFCFLSLETQMCDASCAILYSPNKDSFFGPSDARRG